MALDVPAELAAFERAFARAGSPRRATSEKAYMKSALDFHGVDQPFIRAAARTFDRAHPALARAELVHLAEALLASRWFDLRSLAVALLERRADLLVAADAPRLARWARTTACWAHVDWLATKVGGPLLARSPALDAAVRRWARDPSPWVRRLALLVELDALGHGGGDFERFTALAVPMLVEREFFIRKAIGWVLRAVSRDRPQLVVGFLRRHGGAASGLTFREATRHLPPAQRRALEARRLQRGVATKGGAAGGLPPVAQPGPTSERPVNSPAAAFSSWVAPRKRSGGRPRPGCPPEERSSGRRDRRRAGAARWRATR